MREGVRVSAAVQDRNVDITVDLPSTTVTAIVGPNGAGKSTLVGLVCGLIRPDTGTVSIDGHVVASPEFHIPPHRRRIALLEQHPLLFPHLDVADNVAFGVQARGTSRTDARRRAIAELDAVGAAALAGRRPTALSSGEAQRVALARALATDPTVILLDEPFASLDVPSAVAMRHLLAARLPASGAAVALVTHDPLDIWALADWVVCLEAGRVVEAGEVAAVLGRPSTGFLADLSGMNLLQGMTDRDGIHMPGTHVEGMWDDGRAADPGHPAVATFEPAAVALFRDPPHGSPRNTWDVRVTGVESRGAAVRVQLELTDGQALCADVTAHGAASLALAVGETLVAQVKATQVSLYPRR